LGAGATVALGALAGCSPKSLAEAKEVPTVVGDYDLVIVGSGGAGMAAGVSAHDSGARVAILEKMPVAGGNTCFAEGGMNVCNTKYQAAEGIEDSVELFVADTYKGGRNRGDKDLITYMCAHSNEALEWLGEKGIVLSRLGRSGGASVPRIHRPESGEAVGKYIVRGMTAQCAQRGIAPICNTNVQEILFEGGRVNGVRALDPEGNNVVYRAKAVIIASGGFGANHPMLAQYRPELLEAVTTNQPGSQGDGIRMASAIGADLVDIDQIQVHPTVEQGTATLLSEGIRGDGAILVNTNGLRFTNELLTRDVVSAIEWEQPGRGSWAVFDQKVYDANTSIKEKFVKRNIIQTADTLELLADRMGLAGSAKESFLATVHSYNEDIAAGEPDEFGRSASLEPIEDAPYYAVAVAPGIHHCMGGIRINADAQVLDVAGEPLAGLFAAGEVTGGVHGGNRIGGNAICDIHVYGLRAGRSALSYIGLA
jgi:fumarate reductase flavoprotein subunit